MAVTHMIDAEYNEAIAEAIAAEKKYRKKKKKLIKFLAHMCHCAQSHVGDEEAWGPLKNQEDRLQCTSFVVACFVSQNTLKGHDGVEWEVVIRELCAKLYTVKQWKSILKKVFKQYE